jgi:hypothetical protein
MKMITTLAAGAAMAFAAIPFASPAMAQGTDGPITRHEGKGPCPSGWNAGTGSSSKPNENQCYKGSSGSPAYHIGSGGKCAEGYVRSFTYYCIELSGAQADQRSAADKLVSYGTITKANPLDRCPLGYFSKADMTICTTRLSPAPKSRKNTGACNSNEIDEWGLYCTADATVITREQAEQEADRDFNAIYSANGAQGPTQTPSGDDTTNSAPMVAAYGRRGGAQAAASTSSSESSGDQPAAQQTAQCTTDTGSATGAAIGGAVGGDAGAALGGMLGGLGKKKKKKGC